MTNKNNNLILEDEKDEKLSSAIKEIEKLYGKGSVMFLGQGLQLKIDTISTGSLLLDSAIGVGGYPKGRIIEIFGPESSGKTTLALHAIAQCQIGGGTAAFIDAEHALDPNYAKKIGVNLDSLIVAQPDSGEQGLDILETLVKSEVVDLVVVDSVAALVPKAELEGEMSDITIGAHARLMSKALRKLNGIICKTNSVVIFINQIREKVGVIFGNPEITTGGRALRFYASVRLEVRKSETLQNNGVAHANRVKIKVVKNKVAAPFRSVLLDIYYQSGIDQVFEIIDLGVMYNIIDKAGVWYSYENNKIGQGKEKTRDYLINNPEVLLTIKNQILEKIIF